MSDVSSASGNEFLAKDKKNINEVLKSFSKIKSTGGKTKHSKEAARSTKVGTKHFPRSRNMRSGSRSGSFGRHRHDEYDSEDDVEDEYDEEDDYSNMSHRRHHDEDDMD